MNLSEIKEKLSVRNQFDKVTRRTKKNEVLAEFYEQLSEDIEENRIGLYNSPETLLNIADRMRKCCRYWDIDHYRFQGVKDLLRTNCCRNRFCDNCQNVMAIQRERKFAPVLDDLAKNYDVYHIVFTVPNVYGDELKPCLDNMYKQFAYVNRLFSGDAKIKGISFLKYGYIGAVRALEITKNRIDGTFHPHFHSLFILKKGLKLDKGRKHVNRFSFNNPDIKKSHHKKEYGEPHRYFSDFEILLQKVWRLRYDGIKLTEKNINTLKEGYSVICDNAAGRYKEIFKYATKGIFKEGEENALGGYHDFLPLFTALHGRRLVQGYKLLNGFDFEDIDQSADEAYRKVREKLEELEKPIRVFEFLNEIEDEMGKYTYISRSAVAEIMGDDYESSK